MSSTAHLVTLCALAPRFDSVKVLYVDPICTPTARANVVGLLKAYSKVADVRLFDYRARIPRRKRGRLLAVRAMNRALLRTAEEFRPDIIHLGKCEIVYGGTVRAMKKATGAYIVHCFGDWRSSTLPFVWQIGREADVTAFSNTDPALNARYKRLGIKRIEFWCAGTDPAVFKPYNLKKVWPAVFMANVSTVRSVRSLQGPRDEFLLALARAGVPVHLFGERTGTRARMHSNLHAHGYVTGSAFASVCSQAKIALGFGVDTVPNYTSWPRLVNSMASGAFYLTRYFLGLENFFGNHQHLVWFRSIPEGVRLAKHYLARDAKREAIARAGRAEVLANHTWDARIAQILRWAHL